MINIIELEAQKASLARQILSIDNQTMINNIWLVMNGGNLPDKPKNRETDFFEQLKQPQKTLGDFLGLLSENEYVQLKEFTSQARKEWDRAF